ncbi:MAG: hypothetical protein ACM358_04235 [Gemmatimonadota bacterium]
MSDRVLMVVSIDTEEDNWYRSRERVTCENIRELEHQARFFDRLGVRPTYFTSYQVAIAPAAANVISVVGPRGEIAAHLHPWNTPPLSEAFVPRNSMLKNLPGELQRAKLETLTTTLAETFGLRPRAFRAGRYGLGASTVAALQRCGYLIDSSVTPSVSWEDCDDGPSFVGAPRDAYRLAPDRDVTRPAAGGDIVEVPLSCGFTRGRFRVWRRTRTMLSPELASAGEMLALSRHLLECGVRHLHLTWHSPSLIPGLGPFTRTQADVQRLYAVVADYLDRLARITSPTFVTVSEAAAILASPPSVLPEVATC